MKAAWLLLALACGRAPSNAPQPVPPDVQFVRDMIAHHAQAIAMTGLARTRSNRDQLKLLAERIDVSQADEIKRMNRWLQARGAWATPNHDTHTGGHVAMPGMLTATELDRLRSSTGSDFDRLFLAFMIRHHEGALVMVQRLSETPNGVRDAELFNLASSIDADQRAEIVRMRVLLSNFQ